MGFKYKECGVLVQALKALGQEHVDEKVIDQIRQQFDSVPGHHKMTSVLAPRRYDPREMHATECPTDAEWKEFVGTLAGRQCGC